MKNFHPSHTLLLLLLLLLTTTKGKANDRYRGAANWTASAGILDDIMRLPLAYELEGDSSGSSKAVADSSITYVPWDGPESSYIPVSMVKVLRPGRRESGLAASSMRLNPDLSIVGRLADCNEGPLGSGNGTSDDTGSSSSKANGKQPS